MTGVINGSFAIHLYVSDLERSAAWYCEHLGLTLGDHDYSDYAELKLDGKHFMHLFRDDSFAALQKPSFYLHSSDIELAYSTLKEKRVRLSEMNRYSDHADFVFFDLDGHAVGLVQYGK